MVSATPVLLDKRINALHQPLAVARLAENGGAIVILQARR